MGKHALGGLVRSRRKPQMGQDFLGLERICRYKALNWYSFAGFFTFFFFNQNAPEKPRDFGASVRD